MNITLFTIGCPKCVVLEKKLDSAGIKYEKCEDKDSMIKEGIDVLPILSVDGKKMKFKEAVEWVNEKVG